MMNIQKIFPFRLITFDVTNTLLNFKENVGQTYGDIAIKYGIKCDPNKITANFKREFKTMNLKHPNYGYDSDLEWKNWWQIVVRETFYKSQSDLNDQKLDLICSELIESYKTSKCWQPAPGTFEMLNYLKNSGVSMGIISNFDPRLHEILVSIRINCYFDFVLTSYEIGVAKPDRRIFEKAMCESKLSNLRNYECLHIGDDVKLDYEGARNVGWTSYLILRNKKAEVCVGSKNEQTFDDLNSLKKYFEMKWDNVQHIHQ